MKAYPLLCVKKIGVRQEYELQRPRVLDGQVDVLE